MSEQTKKPVNPTVEMYQQMAQKIRKDRAAFAAVIILALLYISVAFADFLAPYSESWSNRAVGKAPPSSVYLLNEDGSLSAPYTFAYKRAFDASTLSMSYAEDQDTKYTLRFFTHGEKYKLFGVIPSDLHLIGVDKGGQINLLGTDINGRDIFSRMLFGGQISLTIGFLSLFIVFPVGLIYGGIAGYFGGRTDDLMMRFAEIIMSIPSLYLLIGLAAILPPGLTSTERFTLVIFILAFIGWASLSRIVRGMVLSLKSQEYVDAARAIGLNPIKIITKHILPQTASFVLVAVTLSVPGYILAESALSFLGLGIQQPDASWGNMLQEAQDITNLRDRPLMLAPGFMIFLAVLAFNVIGDAVRDIMDPKAVSRR